VLAFLVGMSLENECLTGFCWSNAEIDACGSTGNLLIWKTLGVSFFLNEEKPLPPKQKNVITFTVMTFF